jgi:hypothetical protein
MIPPSDSAPRDPEYFRARARRYREMALTATSSAAAESLTRLAERFEALAEAVEKDEDASEA